MTLNIDVRKVTLWLECFALFNISWRNAVKEIRLTAGRRRGLIGRNPESERCPFHSGTWLPLIPKHDFP